MLFKKTRRILVLCIFALLAGTAIVGCKSKYEDPSVTSNSKKHVYTDLLDNIIITAFHPISYPELLTQEQFDLAADAGIDVMEYCGAMRVTDPASMKLALQFAANAGILCNVYDDRIQNNALSMSREELFAIFNEYKGRDGLGGYYILDEAVSPNDYAKLINEVIEFDPNSTPFFNNYPDIWNDGYYQDRLSDLAHLIINKDNFVLSFDNYPFGPAPNSVDEYNLFKHFEAIRQAGNENNVRTGFYAQVISYGYRKLNRSETLYHVNVGLAYGCTEINYFAWGTPNEVLCPGFGDGVIDRNGNPTDLYYAIKEINRYAHTIGPTLVKLRAAEVYHSGANSTNPVYQRIPQNFFVQSDSYIILSLMEHKITGRNYLMVVNKYMNAPQTIGLRFTDVGSLSEVNQTTGNLTPIGNEYKNGVFTRTLDAGAAVLLALPEGVSFVTPKKIKESANLFENAYVLASDSRGSSGWFVNRVNDGITISEEHFMGWQAIRNEKEWLQFDLGEVKEFNRLDLYPAGNGSASGVYFPSGVKISVSNDGKTWTTVKNIENIEQPTITVPTFRFNKASARYVRLDFVKRGNICELAEAKLYNDDGSIPMPDPTDYVDEEVAPGENIAKGKPVVDYSSNYEHPEWNNSIHFVTDGNYKTNWASDVLLTNTQDSIEYLTIDLQRIYDIEKIILHPMYDANTDGYTTIAFPIDFRIDISTDGTTFTTVAEYKGGITDTEPLTITFTPTKGRYVRVYCTKLQQHPGALNAYMVQFSEIEVFTYMDELTGAKRTLQKAITEAKLIDLNFYVNSSRILLNEAISEAEQVLSTQSDNLEALLNAVAELNDAISKMIAIPLGDNIALGKPVTATSDYVAPEGIFKASYLTDGINPVNLVPYQTHNGWSINVYDDIKRDTPVDIIIDLEQLETIASIMLQPANYDAKFYPTSYQIMTSPDGNNYQIVAVVENIEGVKPGDVLRYKVDNVLARYIKIHITLHSPYTAGTPAYISQFGEIEVYSAVEYTEPDTNPTTNDSTNPFIWVVLVFGFCCMFSIRNMQKRLLNK
ncbi:MAG TPA: discoidin domain-containing protein [Clostridia bacterium]|nr:discoidin domain-containing protein [Clostridia bacterium]